ncbi:unnamed protein product [Lasius platythorax]|uniref:Uncharacterized protein n=1 Tax=Lasius platythorax TaxID=488582 RepID=A0AAV2MYB9_9HYME
MKEGKSLEHAVNLFLFDYRSKEHCTTKRSPAWMMLKRELHTRFDLLKPCVADDVEKSMQAQIAATDGKRRVSPAEGDAVMVDDHTVRGPKRVEAKITKKLSPVTYEIGVGSTKWKRHIDQIVLIKEGPRRSERLKQNRDKSLA